MRYYIADNHFFHQGINNRMDCRGFPSAEIMNNYMINQWNSRVRHNDEEKHTKQIQSYRNCMVFYI